VKYSLMPMQPVKLLLGTCLLLQLVHVGLPGARDTCLGPQLWFDNKCQ
jgi:hypothetical protein